MFHNHLGRKTHEGDVFMGIELLELHEIIKKTQPTKKIMYNTTRINVVPVLCNGMWSRALFFSPSIINENTQDDDTNDDVDDNDDDTHNVKFRHSIWFYK